MSKNISRVCILSSAVVLGALVIFAIILAATLGGEEAASGADILDIVPLIDGHNDLPFNLRTLNHNFLKNFTFEDLKNDPVWWNCSTCFTDLKRLLAGKLGAQFWVAYVPCKSQYKDAVEQTLEQIDVIKRLIQKYPDHLQLVTTADGIWEAFRKKKIGSLIGVEGGHSIDSRLAVLRQMYDLGVRYLTLTHACNTPWARASPVDNVSLTSDLNKEHHGGLTEFGKTVVLEMNRLGMLVDLSHVSHQTMIDAISITKSPVIFSHSSAYALCNHHRNVHDDVLVMTAKNGGVVMVNFYSEFVQCNTTRNATVDDVIAHINHIRKVAGVNHVGIGSDYDGVDSMPVGLEDVSKYPHLFERLAQTNEPRWSTEDLKKLAGLNLIRVFKEVELVRDKLAKTMHEPHHEDLLPVKDLGSNTDCRTNLNATS
ncbi:dipeptidase 1-like [Zootermopsis nevadensis]|uniref:dipeptidase 1-like n=1 Tax=Zootermopsis nevadensis TaxID=136037 RepID=UPI000B8ED540|nr:dipeptidase 1-like [Zootermopsis nevadensis]